MPFQKQKAFYARKHPFSTKLSQRQTLNMVLPGNNCPSHDIVTALRDPLSLAAGPGYACGGVTEVGGGEAKKVEGEEDGEASAFDTSAHYILCGVYAYKY